MMTERLDFLGSTLLLALARLVGEELWVDEGNDTTLTDDHVAEEFVQPAIVDGRIRISGMEMHLMGRTLRHYGWRAGDDGEQYAASCCRVQHCQPTRGSRQRDIQGQRQGKLSQKCFVNM